MFKITQNSTQSINSKNKIGGTVLACFLKSQNKTAMEPTALLTDKYNKGFLSGILFEFKSFIYC